MLPPRLSCLAAAAMLLAGTGWSQAPAPSNWVDEVFPVREHDFGAVAVASKAEFRFPVVNKLDKPMHLQSVRASCGCTNPIIQTPTIRPGETGTILARFNTDSSRGRRNATVTVVIDEPFNAEVLLEVTGYIRRDIVIYPGQLTFDSVDAGIGTTMATKVYYAGREDWAIRDVQSPVPWLQPTLNQEKREGGSATYRIDVALAPNAPTGDFQHELILTTNDEKLQRVPLPVSGRVEQALAIAPRSIPLGDLAADDRVTQRLIVRSKNPVAIGSIVCEGWKLDYQLNPGKRRIHVINVTFSPDGVTGSQRSDVIVSTDEDQPHQTRSILTANVTTGDGSIAQAE